MFKYSPRCLKILLSYSNHRIETAFSRPFSHPFHKNTEENETVRESPIWGGGGGSNTIRINLTIEGGSHVSEKFFESFVPGNERHRSKEIPSSLFLPFIKLFRAGERLKGTGKWKFSFESQFCFFFRGRRWESIGCLPITLFRLETCPVSRSKRFDRADIRMIDACQQSQWCLSVDILMKCTGEMLIARFVRDLIDKINSRIFSIESDVYLLHFIVGLNLTVKFIIRSNE